jgi:CheY-like chemotaxis protein
MAKILIIDDDPDFVDATRMVLEKEGHTIIHASNGREGYQTAVTEKPDLVILDVIMDTVLDGLSTSDQMHDDEATRDIPIIMVTSIANTDYAELFPTDDLVYIRAFLSKPINPAGLIKQVNKLLK